MDAHTACGHKDIVTHLTLPLLSERARTNSCIAVYQTLSLVEGKESGHARLPKRHHKSLGIKEQVKREPTVGDKSKPDRSPDTERPDRCCGKHAHQSLDLYCRQCKELTCKDCVAIDRKHNLHDYDLVSKVAPDFRRSVIDRLSAVEGIRKNVEEALQVASQTRKDIGREKADLNRDTDRLFGDHQPFDARVFTQRLSLTNRTMDNQLERVQCFEVKLQLIWSELDDLVISFHQSAFEKNNVEFLSSIADIFQHIKNVSSKYVGLSKLPLKFPYSASLLNEKYAVFKGQPLLWGWIWTGRSGSWTCCSMKT